MNRRRRLLSVLVPAAVVAASALVTVPLALAEDTAPNVQITEFAYNGSEFVELTNVGSAAANFAGWSFSDSHAHPGDLDLSGFGTVAAGESVIISEVDAGAFRTEWGLKDSVKVIGGNTQNLGNGDAITIYDGSQTLVDSLTYAKDAAPKTDANSAWVAADKLGSTSAQDGWTLSSADDAQGSWASSGGHLGSPGASTLGTTKPADVRTSTPGGGDEPTIDPNWANIHINEISSDNDPLPVGDAVELYNSGDTAVSVAGWLQIDSGSATSATDFSGRVTVNGVPSTVIPAHGFGVFGSGKGLSGEGDSVKIYLPDGTPVQAVDFPDGAAGVSDTYPGTGVVAYAACGDGATTFFPVATKSFGASNTTACASKLPVPGADNGGGEPGLNCQPEAPSGTGAPVAGAVTWPGSAAPTVADDACAFITELGPEGRDVSGLVFDRTNPAVLWAVKNKSGIFKLVKVNGVWVKDTTGGWGAGKTVTFPGGTGQPDSEGITQGPDGALYVTTERDNAANSIALNSVLRIDQAAAGSTLVATRQWDLTADFPELNTGNKNEANLGFEGLTFVPDSYLVANGFVDSTGRTYQPAAYPKHGTGLFFMALENDGKLYAYALNSDGTHQRVAVVPTGMAHVMDVQYDADTQRIWALCDNSCSVSTTLLKVGDAGTIVPDVVYARPAGLPNLNIEGFAVAPVSTCVGGVREAVWSDDGIMTDGHALFSGTVNCDLHLGVQGVAWVASKVYNTGDRVTYQGGVFVAQWWTQNQKPGDPYGPWAEQGALVPAAGVRAWTASGIYLSGDTIAYHGHTWRAKWWTRNQAPGDPYGPWQDLGSY